MARTQALAVDETCVSRLIDQRYGEGQIRFLLGLVSEEGYVTRHGKRLWAQHMDG